MTTTKEAGAKGGRAAAAKMTKEQRHERAVKAATAGTKKQRRARAIKANEVRWANAKPRREGNT